MDLALHLPFTCQYHCRTKTRSRPPVPVRTSIADYGQAELLQLMRWIASDGQLRTDEQILDEMVVTLGFARRGKRIETAVLGAIASLRSRV